MEALRAEEAAEQEVRSPVGDKSLILAEGYSGVKSANHGFLLEAIAFRLEAIAFLPIFICILSRLALKVEALEQRLEAVEVTTKAAETKRLVALWCLGVRLCFES